jgi:CheY-like chemotaxis protein
MLIASVESLITAISHLLWPLVAAALLIVLLPEIRKRFKEGGIDVDVLGVKVSIPSTGQQVELGKIVGELGTTVEDLQTNLPILSERMDALERRGGDRSPHRPSAGRKRTGTSAEAAGVILWVDDRPENNTLLSQSLRELGFTVVQARTTSEALSSLKSGRYDVVITDLAREENGEYVPTAGLTFLSALRNSNSGVPAVVYASVGGVATYAKQAQELGAIGVTASPTELIGLLRMQPEQRFELQVRREVERAGLSVSDATNLRGGPDFIVNSAGRRFGVEAKYWSRSPSPATLDRTVSRLTEALHRMELSEIIVVTPVPIELTLPQGIRVVALSELTHALASM